MTKISVIIPVYNTEKYIEECVRSVLKNDFTECEIICVNDGSTDSSLDILKRLEEENTCVKVLTQNNGGQSAARNNALKIAQGKYVYFLDSDDKISPDCLSRLYDYLEKDNLDVLYFSGKSFYETEELEEQFQNFANVYLREGDYDGIGTGLELLRLMREQKDYSVSPCIQIIRRDFLQENNIEFVEGIIHEDNYFSFLVSFHAKRAKCVNDVFFQRRIREASVMTTQKTYKNLLGYFTCFLKMVEHVEANHVLNLDDEDVIMSVIRGLRGNINRSFLAIDQDEREVFYENLTYHQRILFKGVFLASIEREVKLNNQLKKSRKKAKKLESSKEYKIGCKITCPIRFMKKIIKKMRRKENA